MTEKLLTPEQVDGLGLSMITLAREFWVLRDRVAVLEKILEKHGIPAGDEINSFVPDKDFEQELTAERNAFIASVLDTIGDPDEKS